MEIFGRAQKWCSLLKIFIDGEALFVRFVAGHLRPAKMRETEIVKMSAFSSSSKQTVVFIDLFHSDDIQFQKTFIIVSNGNKTIILYCIMFEN